MAIKNVLFDLDGTLVDSSGDIIVCLSDAYRACGFDVSSLPLAASLVGPPLREMIRRATPDATSVDVDRVVAAFRAAYDGSAYARTEPYPGAREIVRRCAVAGLRSFVVTNKPRAPARRIVEKTGLGPFVDVVTPDVRAGIEMNKREMVAHAIREHTLLPAETVMVGDSDGDVRSAHENGVHSVGVLGGYGDRDTLEASKPSRLIPRLEALFDALEGL